MRRPNELEFHPIQRLKDHLKRLKRDLEPMSFREKLDHLWTYYKWVAALLALVVILICMIGTSIANINRETLLAGMVINTDISLDGNNYLTVDYFEMRQGIEKKQEVELAHLTFMDPETTTDIGFTYAAVTRIVAEISAQQLDYIITDEVGMETCMNQDALMDLREVLTPEELEFYKDDLMYLHYEQEATTVPVALNMRNHPFSERFVQSEDEHYFAFIANTPRKEICRGFWEYLLAAETAE